MLTPARVHTPKVAWLILAAACLFAGMTVNAADVPSARSQARILADQQLQIQQNPLPADLSPVTPGQVPTVPDLFSLSHWPF
jgi:hypothetical protein